jgi:glycosyltransferase involved in cell wall biosynthesis
MNSSFVSIIMSVYNGEKYLDESIQSILNQTFQDFEFIIIDDCSTDNSAEIIQKYTNQDTRIQFLKKEKNIGIKGFVENLNIGIQKSRGKYIARMDQDDFAFPNRLEKQVEFLNLHQDVFLVGTSMTLMNENSEVYSEKKALTNFDEIKKRIIIDNPIFHPTIMFRNEPNLFYRDKFYASEDFDFYLRLITSGKKIENLEEPLLRYRILFNSMSREGNSFIKRLFLEKAKEFYIQRLKIGIDQYDKWIDAEFKDILDIDFHSKKEDLKFASRTAIIYQRYEELKILHSKLKRYYQQSNYSQFLFKNPLLRKLISYYYKRIFWNI